MGLIGLQWYIFPWYNTYLDTRATIRCTIQYITVHKIRHQQLALLINNLFPILIINLTVITQHQITWQGLKCRAWLRNIKDSDLPNLLMWHILLYRNILFKYRYSYRLKKYHGSPMHWCIIAAPGVDPKFFFQPSIRLVQSCWTFDSPWLLFKKSIFCDSECNFLTFP